MNYGHDRHTIASGIDTLRRHTLDEIAADVGVPPGYMHSIIIERADDFGDLFIEQIARAMGVTVQQIIDAA